MRISILRPIIIFILFLTLIAPNKSSAAQSEPVYRPVDMMIVIDNSCSMFPVNQIRADCDAYGSDPEFLRIAGADLFIARLGFSQTNEDLYQLGVISFGDAPQMVSPLGPVEGSRDLLAAKIARPSAQPATRMLPALQMAYKELAESPNRKEDHVPAIVLITDGVPWPREDQPDEAFEKLINENPDTPVFIMLLQNPQRDTNDYRSYIEFWENVQARYSHVFVYSIKEASQIEETYNSILGQLQNTISGRAVQLNAGQTYGFTINPYVEKVIITNVRRSGQSDAKIIILDPEKNEVLPDQDGVSTFRGSENPVEVYAIESPRLSDELKGKEWTITSTSQVRVIIDRVGAYQFRFLSPGNLQTEIGNIFAASDRQSPSRDVEVVFSLISQEGEPVTEPQRIRASIQFPNGVEMPLQATAGLQPNAEGLYQLSVNVGVLYPEVLTTPGRFVFKFQADFGEEDAQEALPVATSRLIMDIGQTPFIRSVAPIPIICENNQPFELRVNLEDVGTTDPSSLRVRMFYGSETLQLTPTEEEGQYTGELQGFCQAVIQRQFCSSQELVNVLIQLDANLLDGTALVPVTRQVQAQVISPACTPTPLPSLTPTLQPTATPIPDTDMDGINDLEDTCPDISGFDQFDGCIPTNYLLGGVGILGLAIFSTTWLWPFLKVRTFAEPPQGYLLICKEGRPMGEPINIYELGRKKRVSQLRVGAGSKGVQVRVPGLRGIEFVIERRAVLTCLRDPGQSEPFAYLDDDLKTIRTSDPKVVIKASLVRENLHC